MAAQLPRPGVEVVQEFRTVTPTVVTPTLVPCVVGVAKQLVEVLVSDGAGGNSLNPDALISMPAFFTAKAATGNPAVYTGLDGLQLDFSVNNGVTISVVFSDPTAAGLTPTSVVTQVNLELAEVGASAVVAEVLNDTQWILRTVGEGQFQSIQIMPATSPAVATAFGIGIGKTYVGLDSYNQLEVEIPEEAFPDPRLNLGQLAIESSTIRVFLATEGSGTGLQELTRNQSFLRNGVVNDAAQVVGTVDLATLTYPGGVQGKTLTLAVDDGAAQSVTIASSPANAAALIAELNALTTGVTITLQAVTNRAVFTSDTSGAGSKLAFTGGNLLPDLGITNPTTDLGESIAAVDDGNGDIVTPLLDFALENFTATPTQAVLTASLAPTTPGANTTLIITDGQQTQTVVFAGTENNITLLLAAINAVIAPAAGGRLTASNSAGVVRFTHSHFGDESYFKIVGGTALAAIDPGGTPTIIAGATARGVAFKPLPGDRLFIDGVFFANIVQVAPGGVQSRLKIDRQIPISTNVGARFYIQALNLVPGGSATRPYPDLQVSLDNKVQMKHSFIRDPFGNPSDVKAPIYLSYRAVRKDVTAVAGKGLLKFDDTTQLTAGLAPINTDNPLGLGCFFALVNAPGAQIAALGVDEIAADEPLGTVEGFTRAAEYLEGFEVYALAPLTHDESVAQVFNSHVTYMSEPAQKGERIVLWNPETPTRRVDTLVASNTDGDGLTTTTFDTKVASLSALVQNAGISPIGTIATSKGLFLDIAGDDKKYSISAISGSQITIRTSFAAGENDDGYYSTTALPLPIISETFAIRVRGAELVTPTGLQDKTAIAETMQALGQTFLNRRFWMTFPDKCKSTIEGIEQLIDGFYLNAAIVGMIAQHPPQQSFTNFPMTGFTGVVGSNDTFNERQLNIMAAGGTYIIVQDAQGAPLISRHALTTDLTSLESRTDSITKIVDFVAKFMRKALKNFIGRFNITQGFIDSLGSVIQGLIVFLTEASILIGATLDSLIQDEDAPDTVLVEVTLDVPFPCNTIRLTLVV